MADIRRDGNILVVTGSDVHGRGDGYREPLRRVLYDAGEDESPVRKGTHDFWIIYTVPGIGGPNHWGEEKDLWVEGPTSDDYSRWMRGKVSMAGIPDDVGPDALRNHLHLILQEVGHHWLVPKDIELEFDGDLRRSHTGPEMTKRINEERPFTQPLLIGRDDSHWAAFVKSDDSPMDGLNFREDAVEDGYDRWHEDGPARSGEEIQPEGRDPLELRARYNDMEQVLMGLMHPSEAYLEDDNAFTWLEPRLAAPYENHVGVVIILGQGDSFIFGFHKDHRKLAVWRSDGTMSGSFNLGTDYHPLANEFNGVALRVVRRGTRYFFQARYDNPLRGCSTIIDRLLGRPPSNSIPGFFDDLDEVRHPDPNVSFDRFRTLYARHIPGEPEAIGLITKTSEYSHFVEGAFFNLHLRAGGRDQVMSTGRALPPFDRSRGYAGLPEDELRLDDPSGKALVRHDRGRLLLTTPYGKVTSVDGVDGHDLYAPDTFDLSRTRDGAPKALTRAPSGDFVFGTSCKVRRAIYKPWAGGAAEGRTVWGRKKTAPMMSLLLPQDLRDRQYPPPSNTYQMAFIVVAARDEDITADMLDRLETIRSYWDLAFDWATRGLRHSNSQLT